MKAGTDNKTKVRMAIGLCIVAVLVLTWTFMGNRAPDTSSVPVAAAPAISNSAHPAESLDPRLHLDLLATSEEVKYQGSGKNIFRTAAEPIERPKISPLQRKQQEEVRSVNIPPPPPPINLKFFGITNTKGEKPKVFLSQGDDVWIAHEGDVVNRRYKIVRISPTTVEIEDLLNNNRQNIPLTQG
jgi:hypothetical protein